mmetsp:Transcript_26364/g.49530  ORF Transcript_26364/g.49530 Transcript_26364/m.49530 type:complete len:221 (+) Transcript_26364:328-990(+)
MAAGAAGAILPPLVAELEDEAAKAGTPAHGGALAQNFLGELTRRSGLGLAIFAADVRVEGVCSILSQIHRLFRHSAVLVKKAAKADPSIDVDSPNVNSWERENCFIQLPDIAINGGDGVVSIHRADCISHITQLCNAITKTQADIKAVIVPLIAYAPHQNSRMILCRSNRIGGRAGRVRTKVVHTVHDPNAFTPKDVQNPPVGDGLIGANNIDAHPRHEL